MIADFGLLCLKRNRPVVYCRIKSVFFVEKLTFSLYRNKKMNNQIEDPFLSLNTSYRVGCDILDYLAMVPLF